MKKIAIPLLIKTKFPNLDKDRILSYIVCKNVYVNGELCTNPKNKFTEDCVIEFDFPLFVSRGGFKLEKALELFNIDVKNLFILDAGSSTGGFTDCLLQHGAKGVHCVDVGYNLLDYKIRSNPKVIIHEKQNIMKFENPTPSVDGAVADLSFRSIQGAASHILSMTKQGWLIALIKPQFEVPKGTEGFSGVITDDNLMKEVILSVYDGLQEEEVGIYNLCKSPIKGHKGNTEYLALLKKGKGLEKSDIEKLI